MAAPCPLLGDGLTDDTLLNIVRFLPTAKDLVCLQLTNTRFAAKVIAAALSVSAARRGCGGGGSAGDALDPGGGGASVGVGVQRAGAGLGAAV